MCVCMNVIYVYAQVSVKTRGQPHSSSVIYQWGRISHWLLSCLVSMCNHTWMVTWVLEIKFGSSWLHGKHLTDWTISPVPSCILILLYKALSSSLYQHTGECILVASVHKKRVHPSLCLPLFILSPPPMSFSPNELRTVKQLVLSIPLHVTLCLLMPKVDANMVSFLSYLYRSNKSQEEPKIKYMEKRWCFWWQKIFSSLIYKLLCTHSDLFS